MASGTTVRRVLFQISADDHDAEAKIDEIKAKADELAAKNPELKVKIDTAAAAAQMRVLRGELNKGMDAAKAQQKAVEQAAAEEARAAEKAAAAEERAQAAAARAAERAAAAEQRAAERAAAAAGKQSGQGFGQAFSGGLMNPYVIGTGVVAALAGLPAIAASGGALAGIALGAHLLIGTKKVQGPLYAQFGDMMRTLTSVLRVAALPLVKPLAEAFQQVGQWAKSIYPVLRAVFASLGPLVAPFAKGLEGLVSGVLPGFLHLMQAARPAVQAISGLLSTLGTQLGSMFSALIPGVKSSAQFMTGLGKAVFSLLPLVGHLATVAADALGPIMATLGGKLLPQLVNALDNTLTALTPILPPISQLVATILQFQVGPMVGGLNTIGNVLVRLEPVIQTVANMLQGLADLAQTALSWLSRLPGVGGMFSGTGSFGPGGGFGGIAGLVGSAVDPFASGGGGFSVPAGLGNWGAGLTDGMVAAAGKAGKKAAPKIPPALAAGLIQALQGSQSQIGHATLSILKTIWGDEAAGILTRGEASALAAWVKLDNGRLQRLAVERNAIAKEIAAAKQYAAGVTSATESAFGLVNAASGGPFGGPQRTGTIISTLNEEIRRVRSFAQDIRKLAKMGLNHAYIDQLIQAGPVQGGAIADELANGPLKDIRQINAAERGLAAASTGLGQLGADILYDRGRGAGKGFLSGLEAQERRVELAMKKLAEVMVHGTQRELRIEWVGGAGADREFMTWLKRQIRIRGGNPAVLGA